MVDIILPLSGSVTLHFDDATTAKELLLMLAKKPRMRMLRDDFVFHLLASDQARLQHAQPALPPDTLIAALCVEKLELRKRLVGVTRG
jgi:hypothetical protein